jgi:hypothetical protein
MFFVLFSDHIYSEKSWPDVFQVENSVHAVLREYWREMIGLSDDQLVNAMRKRLKKLAKHAAPLELPSDSFITKVLKQEADRIARFVADLENTEPEGRRNTISKYFEMNAGRLQECMSSSEEFRDFILSKRKEAN